jgi:hypothetical protein
MIAALITIVLLTAAGFPFAMALHPDAPPSARTGEAFFIGSAWIPIVMFVLSLLHIPWSVTTIFVCALVPAVAVLPFSIRRMRPPASRTKVTVIDLVTAILIALYAIYATLGPLWEWDFWAIFGVKARAFFDSGGIDWRVLTSPFNLYNNPDYPLALPLLFDVHAVVNGAWDDRWIGLLYPAFTIALVLVTRPLIEKEIDSPLIASAMTLTLAALSFTRTAGTAEAPLVAVSAAALLTLRRGILDDDIAAIRTASILLGVAALMKNEGIAMIAATAVAIWLATRNWRRVAALWPAAACGAAWLLIVRVFDLKSAYLQTESMPHRLATHLRALPDIIGALVMNTPEHGFFWFVALIAIVIAFHEAKRETLLAAFIAVQLLFYIAAYLVTGHPVMWQIHTSWARLLSHVAIPLAFIAFASAARWRNAVSGS